MEAFFSEAKEESGLRTFFFPLVVFPGETFSHIKYFFAVDLSPVNTHPVSSKDVERFTLEMNGVITTAGRSEACGGRGEGDGAGGVRG